MLHLPALYIDQCPLLAASRAFLVAPAVPHSLPFSFLYKIQCKRSKVIRSAPFYLILSLILEHRHLNGLRFWHIRVSPYWRKDETTKRFPQLTQILPGHSIAEIHIIRNDSSVAQLVVNQRFLQLLKHRKQSLNRVCLQLARDQHFVRG